MLSLRFPSRQCRRALSIAGLLAAVLLLALPSGAQSTQGSILGTVKDARGNVIPGAAVTLTNTDEGTVRTTTTNASGDYQFLDSKAGSYSILVAASGFKKWTSAGVVLSARQELRVDASLVVGSVGQTVQVSSTDTAVINTDTPEINSNFTSKEILDLPMNLRASSSGTNPVNLAAALPNVDFKQPYNVFQSVTVNGSMSYQTLFDADGVTIGAISGNHPDGDLLPVTDAIAEIHSTGVLGDAEHNSPAEITFTTKSGTNTLHGGAWEYHQDQNLDARPYGAATRPHLVVNTFGAMLSGPVVIPHLYNGRDRSFFWFDYEGFRSPQSTAKQYTVPTPALLKGDFTNFVIPDGKGGNQFQGLTNPATGKVCGYTFAQCGFSINSAAQQFLQFYPAPNHTATVNNGGTTTVGTDEFVAGETANYWANYDTSQHSDQFDVRGDQYFGSNQKLLVWGRLVYKNYPSTSPNGIDFPSSTTQDKSRNVILSANWSIKPDMINELRFGYARFLWGPSNPFDGKAFTEGLGLQGLTDLWQDSLPEIGVPYFSTPPTRMNKQYDNKAWVYTDDLSWVKGLHTLKFGFNWTAYKAIDPTTISSADQFGNFSFGGATQFTGNGWADFLLGIPYSTTYDVVPADNNYIAHTWAAYAQDQWRATPRLTLTYGLRYEFNPGFYDKHGLFANFDQSVALSGRFIYPDGTAKYLNQPYLEGINACDPDGVNNTNSATLNGAPCTPVVSASEAGVPKALHKTTKDGLLPRFGFAYRLTNDDKWVIRGGFGMYNNVMSADMTDDGAGMLLQAGYSTYYNGYQGGGTSGTPLYQWPQIYAGSATAGHTTSPGHANIDAVPGTRWHDPYSEQWNLTLEHDLGNGYGVRLSYIGSVSRHLMVYDEQNILPVSSTTEAYSQPMSARTFPNFGKVELLSTRANSNYNGIQLDVAHRYRHGLGFDSTFTWARALSDQVGNSGSFPEEDGETLTYSPDIALDYGNLMGPHKLAWKTNATYALPIGRGQALGANMPRALDAIVGGWNLSNIFEWDSGYWLTVDAGSGNDPSGTGSGATASKAGWNTDGFNQYPDLVAGQKVKASHATASQWLNPDAFTCPGDPNWKPGFGCYTGNGLAINTTYNGQTYNNKELINGTLYDIPGPIGRFGYVHPGSILGPQFVQWNAGLAKTFALGERFRLRAEGTFTNVLNHTNLDGTSMNTSISSASYGYISSAIAARSGQVSLRLTF